MKKIRKTLAYLWLAAAVVAIGGLPSGALAQGADDARYLVTWFKSDIISGPSLRTASIVSVTNQSNTNCQITVEFKINGLNTRGGCSVSIPTVAGQQVDLCTRSIPPGITSCQRTCAPPLVSAEGNAIVSSENTTGCENIAVSARTVYTSHITDEPVGAITDAKVVKIGQGNNGD
jgi:hypothetical protein